MIASFGKLFSPVVYDMNGNIEVSVSVCDVRTSDDLIFAFFVPQKLHQIYRQNEEKYTHLDQLLVINEPKLKSRAFDSLLWLKRALEMLERFFSNIVDDDGHEESLKEHIHAAYCVTLKQYHNWIIQKSFAVRKSQISFVSHTILKTYFLDSQVIYGLLPYRSQLLGNGDIHVENLKSLEAFLRPMREHLQLVNSLLVED